MNRLLKYVELNLSELCNYTCNFCPRGHGYPNSNVHMSMETAKTIVKQLEELGQPVTVQLAGRGEPTLAKNFGKIAELLIDLKNRSLIKIEMNTNGKKVDEYLHLIEQFDDVVYNVYAETLETPQAIQRKYPFFRIKNKKDPFFRNWKTRSGYIPDQINPEPQYNHHIYGEMCHKPFEVVYINWNGDYNLCCDVWKDIEAISNIFDEPIKDYTTKNKRLNEYRSTLIKGKRSMSPCNECNIQCSVEFLVKMKNLHHVST